MTKGQIIPRLLHALTHVLCFLWLRVELVCVPPLDRGVSRGGGGVCVCWKNSILEHRSYKRVSASGILSQDMMLDDKLLLKCEGGGLGYEMPNGFPWPCSLHGLYSILRAEAFRDEPDWNTFPLCCPAPSAGMGVFSIQHGILGGVCLELPAPGVFPHAKGWCW